MRILIIDDDQFAADTARALLELEGHEVEVAYGATAGIALAQCSGPDVVLCDLDLAEGRDGFYVARTIRGDPDLRGALLVAVTGFAHQRDRVEAESAGFDRFVSKPVDVIALARTFGREEAGAEELSP
jgi:CheY-like chemotaxis protein